MRCLEPLRISSKFWILLLLPLGVWAQVTITLHSHAKWHRGLSLGEIADISSEDKRVVQFLKGLQIPSQAAADGRVERSEVVELLRSHMIDPKRVRVGGGPLLLFTQASTLTKERLEKAIEAYVRQNYPEVKIERVLLNFKKMALPEGEYRLAIFTSSKTPSRLYLDMRIHSGGELLRRVHPTVLVTTYLKVPVAVRTIQRGQIIGPEDIRWERRALRGSLSRYPKIGEVIGAVAKRKIEAGRLLTRSAIELDYAVKKRRNVKIVYQKGAIRIELLGLALQNGRVGDIVRVKNLSSNKVLRCKVLQNGVVGYLY